MEFSRAFYNIQYKYNISVKQWQQSSGSPHQICLRDPSSSVTSLLFVWNDLNLFVLSLLCTRCTHNLHPHCTQKVMTTKGMGCTCTRCTRGSGIPAHGISMISPTIVCMTPPKVCYESPDICKEPPDVVCKEPPDIVCKGPPDVVSKDPPDVVSKDPPECVVSLYVIEISLDLVHKL